MSGRNGGAPPGERNGNGKKYPDSLVNLVRDMREHEGKTYGEIHQALRGRVPYHTIAAWCRYQNRSGFTYTEDS